MAEDAARANVTIHTFTAELWALAATRSRPSDAIDRGPEPAAEQRRDAVEPDRRAGHPPDGQCRAGLCRAEQRSERLLPPRRAGAAGGFLDGKTHKIGLKVSRPGTNVASFRRILAATRAQPPPAVDPQTLLRDALKGGPAQTSIGLRATFYRPARDDQHPRPARRRGRRRDPGLGRIGQGGGRTLRPRRPAGDGDGEHRRRAGGRPGQLSIELTAPPGSYVLRVAVLDAEGHVGSLDAWSRRTGRRPVASRRPAWSCSGRPRGADRAAAGLRSGDRRRRADCAGPAQTGRFAEKKTQVVVRGGTLGQHDAAGAPHRADRRHHGRHDGGAGNDAGLDAAAGPLHADRPYQR